MEGFVKISLNAYIRSMWRCQWSKSEFNSEGDDPLRCCESDITSGSAACHGEILGRILLLPVNNKSEKTWVSFIAISEPFYRLLHSSQKCQKSNKRTFKVLYTKNIFSIKAFSSFQWVAGVDQKTGSIWQFSINSRRFSKLFLQHSLRLFGSPVSHYLSPLHRGSVSVPMTAAPCHPGGGCQTSIRCLAPAQVTAHITEIT